MTIVYIWVWQTFEKDRSFSNVCQTQIPTDESMKDETPLTGILNFTHLTISFSRFTKYFACLDTSFLVQSDYIPFGSDQIFFDIFYRYNFNSCISNFMFHKFSTVLIFLRFAFIQLQIVFLSLFIFYPQFHQIQHNFTGIHFANNTRSSHYHISNYTL